MSTLVCVFVYVYEHRQKYQQIVCSVRIFLKKCRFLNDKWTQMCYLIPVSCMFMSDATKTNSSVRKRHTNNKEDFRHYSVRKTNGCLNERKIKPRKFLVARTKMFESALISFLICSALNCVSFSLFMTDFLVYLQ